MTDLEGAARDAAGAAAAQAEAQAGRQAESDRLMDLARRCDTDELRGEATEALEGVIKAHLPPPAPRFRW